MSDQAIKNPLIKQGWLRVLLFGIAFCLTTILIAVPAVLIIVGVKKDDLQADPIHTLASQLTGSYLWLVLLLECLISLISVWIFRVFVDRKSFSSLGWEMTGYGAESAAGLFMGPALLGISALLLLLSGHLQWTDINWDPQSLFISLGLMGLIAFSEELVFRGYILNNLLDTFPNKWIALGISAVLFAALHITNPGMNSLAFANLFLAGLLLGINYIYTKNLWYSLFFHLSWNFFQGPLLGLKVSGHDFPSLLVAETKGDLLVTGGDFGLEGSVLNMAASIIAILVLAWAFERKYNSGKQIIAK
ncbi:MAG TPA: CPBP family intramembrane glutamic endopeptidase [Puia sp.]|nr:CPBP family intramembrane glutamic endopeptidase [Puia sp.]